jgi:hypothetical protein
MTDVDKHLDPIKVLVLHALTEKSRLTNVQFARSFGLHASGCEVTYLNVLGINVSSLQNEEFDLAIVTYELLAMRAVPFWPHIEQRILKLLTLCTHKVLLPQDDYTYTTRLDNLAVTANVDAIYTPLTKDLDQLYPQAIMSGVRFHEALTGYIEDANLAVMSEFTIPMTNRTIDLGQRVRHLSPQFGAEASKKGFLAENFADLARDAGFVVDVSSRFEDTFVGISWLHFLANCKFTISRKGGASIADPNGKLAKRIYNKSAWRKDLDDPSIEKLIREKEIRRGDFSAISPRLFEAAAMRVCQILEVDDYLGVLEPWVHYIPIRHDFSNIEEVFSAMKDGYLVEKIVENCYNTLIANGNYSYQTFVRELIQREVPNSRVLCNLEVSMLDLDCSLSEKQGNGEQWHNWCKTYSRNVFLKKRVEEAIDAISAGDLLELNNLEPFSADLSQDQRSELKKWLEGLSMSKPFIESYIWSWRSTTYFDSSN